MIQQCAYFCKYFFTEGSHRDTEAQRGMAMEHGELTRDEVFSHRDTEAQRGMAMEHGELTRDEVCSHRDTEAQSF